APKRARFQADLGLTAADAVVLTAHPALSALLEETAEALRSGSGGKLEPAVAGKRAANFIQAEVLRSVKLEGLAAQIPVSAAALGELRWLVEKGDISGKIAKEVLPEMIETGRSAKAIIEARGISQVTDMTQIEQAVRAAIASSPDNVAAYKGGKAAVLGWFV